ncbi:MAG TPA: hypothetical protein VGS07_29130 [Thermoanaerobaculia bacterium]|jgi:hypothetical protein|nr:hypothetical protein [Thermoanaerobaculia bacterium]
MKEVDKQRAAAAIRARMLDSFAPTYLTLISILQGSLLGYLFIVSDGFLGNLKDQSMTSLGLARILFIGADLVVNIATWNEYRMGSTTFVWIPRLLDTLVPFGLAMIQFSLVRTIMLHPKYWFLSVAGFWVIAGFAFWHMYCRASGEPEINGAALQALSLEKRSNHLLCAGGATVNLIFAALLWDLTINQIQSSIALLISATMSTVFMVMVFVRGELSWNRVIRFSRGGQEKVPGCATRKEV